MDGLSLILMATRAGAICHNDDQPSQIALPGCRGCGATGVCDRHRTEADILQPVTFGCIEFCEAAWSLSTLVSL
jgi:hypothetical protein